MGRKRRKYKNGAQIRRSREDLKSGPMADIWLKFFKPLIDSLEDAYEEKVSAPFVIDLLFSGRDIVNYRVKKDMYAVGQEVHKNPYNFSSGNEVNKIKRDSRIIIRQDITQSYTDMELEDGRVFRMSNRQFEEMSRHLSKEQ